MAAALPYSHGPSHGATEAHSLEAANASPLQTGERNRIAWVVPIPSEDSILKTSIIHKIQKNGSWGDRQLYLTSRELGFSYVDGDALLDFIPLSEIDTVSDSPGGGGMEQFYEGSFKGSMCFTVVTQKDGVYHGKSFEFRCNTERERADWIDAIITAIRTARLAGVWSPFLHTCQIALRKLTDTTIYQFLVIMAIISNFLCNIVEAQLNPIPEGSFREKQFMVIDLFFISFFCVELALNMGAHWFWEFWEDKANWLDTLVVLLSVIGIFTSGGSAFTVIRIMRVFRVLRVFKRLASVRLILKALASAVVPVSNAFFIMLLATTIWAILGVNLFDKRSPQFFGNFGAAFFSMFQCVTGDSWSSGIARELMHVEEGKPQFEVGVFIFFTSYMLLVSMVVVNVVLAVLLDEFLRAASSEKNIQAMDQISQKTLETYQTPLDPLLEHLAHAHSMQDLANNINNIFRAMDVDGGGELAYEELASGLRKLPFTPTIDLTQEDFAELINGIMPDQTTSLHAEEFIKIIGIHTYRYMHRRADKALFLQQSGLDLQEDTTELFLLKYLTSMMSVQGAVPDVEQSTISPVSPVRKSPEGSFRDASGRSRHSVIWKRLEEQEASVNGEEMQGVLERKAVHESSNPPQDFLADSAAVNVMVLKVDKLSHDVDVLSSQQGAIQERCVLVDERLASMERTLNNKFSSLEALLEKLMDSDNVQARTLDLLKERAMQATVTDAQTASLLPAPDRGHGDDKAAAMESKAHTVQGDEGKDLQQSVPLPAPSAPEETRQHPTAIFPLAAFPPYLGSIPAAPSSPRRNVSHNGIYVNGGRPVMTQPLETAPATGEHIPLSFSIRSSSLMETNDLDVNVPILNALSPRRPQTEV